MSTAESFEQHGRRTGHRVSITLTSPWRCEECPARSALWDAPVTIRRVPFGLTHTWESQECQYIDRTDIRWRPGITHWTVPRNAAPVPIECLLYREDRGGLAGRLVGILNYFPEGSPVGDLPGDTLTLVRPEWRRKGIGKALLTEALRRWPAIDLLSQSYTDEGYALATSVLKEMNQ